MGKSGARILIVDDEVEIVRALQRSLVAHGYEVFTAHSGEEALEAWRASRPDVMLLDLGLPGISGLEVCQKVRALDLGADDYVPKPFGIDEVLARIRVALRHSAMLSSGTQPRFESGPLCVELAQRLVTLNGQEVKLTPTEYDLLKVLIQHKGKIMTRQMLLKEVWGAGYGADSHYLHVYIGQLRRKIEPDPASPRFILTIPGVGYRFTDEPS